MPEQVRSKTYTGIRPFDMGRDLRPVAELIADAFADELDAGGKAALREMRVLSYMGTMFGFFNRNALELNSAFGGFVWIENGRVVGNVTVQRGDNYGNRWQIANVAVNDAYRGRGIARQLVQTALEYITEMGGRWATLQVRGGNEIALGLYERIGFENLGGTMRLEIDRVPRGVTFPRVEGLAPFSAGEWRSLYEIASSQHGTQAQWWRPLRQADFRRTPEQNMGEWFSRILGRRDVLRRAKADNLRRFDGAAVLTAQRWRGNHELQLWVRPRCQGELEADIIQWALAELQEYPRLPIQVEVSTHHTAAIQVLEGYGFRNPHTLLTMRYKLVHP